VRLQVIRAAGSHYEIGRAVGKAAEKQMAAAVYAYKKIMAVEGWRGPWILPEQYLSSVEEIFPHFVEELRGLADGSGQSFSDLFFLNALEEVLDHKEARRCTTVGVRAFGAVLLGHNEDWYQEDAGYVVVIHARPAGKPAFISVTSAPFLAAVGMNEVGLAQGINSVSSVDSGAGVPRNFVARAVLEGETMADAVSKATPRLRAGGYNHMLATRAGEMGNLETSAGVHHFAAGYPVIFHTNHYISPEMQPLGKSVSPHSIARYRRLEWLKEELTGAAEPRGALEFLLRDHVDRPRCICNHAVEQEDHQGTIFSVIFDLQDLSARVAVGNPCRNRYQPVSLAREG